MTKLVPLGLLGCVLVFSIICLGAQEPAAQILHNNDVVSLSKAGLSDSAIAAVIRKSKTSFDLKPDDLVSLRQQGVSNAVIETMLGLHAPEAATESRSASSVESSGIALPTQYGYYVIEHGAIRQIYPLPVRTVIGISGRIPPGWAVDGVSGEPTFTLTDPRATFVIYQQNVDVQRARYGAAAFLRSMRAADFDGANVNPQFFAGIYNKNPNDIVAVNLWRPQGAVRFAIEPVVERPGMFKMRPQGPLAPGRYISFFEDLMHMDGTIFVASQTEPVFALFFAVSLSSTATSQSITTPEGAGLIAGDNASRSASSTETVPSPSCADYDACLKAGTIAFDASQGVQSLGNFRKASKLDPSKGDAWAGMGNAYLQIGQYEDAVRMWDKALELGATLSSSVCHAKAACGDTGDFLLSTKEVSFVSKKGEKEFAAAPSAVTSEVGTPPVLFGNGRIAAYYVQLRFSGKNYRFYYGPKSLQCRSNFLCSEPGLTQQKVFADYVHGALVRMAAGDFVSRPNKP